ncbi:MAG: hypothetical protein HYZ50_02910 [Deltaproteobacteria bacterium]|nr:hypothetical protein [Deltaproteobacteria bacterium]
MSTLPSSSRSAAFWVLLACGCGWWLVFSLLTGVTLEDTLITCRYAQNIAAGNGFVFNPGQHVLGTTTPLVTLFLALVGTVSGPATIPLAATLTMATFGVLTGVVVYSILAELEYPLLARLLSLPLFFGSRLILVPSVGGMETPLALFCMAASGLALLRRQPLACLLFSAVLMLTRPDGIVWAALISLAVIWQSRKIPWKAVFVSIGILLPWLLFAVWYFGSPLPHSVTAKMAIGEAPGMPPRLSLVGLRIFTTWYLHSIGFPPYSGMSWLWLFVLVLGAISYLTHASRRAFGMLLVGYVFLYGLFLYVGRAPDFLRYLAPTAWCAVLLGASGVWTLSCLVSERLHKAGSRLRMRPEIAIAVVFGVCLVQNYGIVQEHAELQANENQTRRAIGLWLRDHTPHDSVVAMEAVGYQAFFSQRTVLDLAGIVSPEVVALKKATKSNAELFFKIVSTLAPDYLVLRSFEVDENRHFHGGQLFETEEQRDFFTRTYRECQRFAAPYPERWGEMSFLTIYGHSAEGGEACR